MTGPRTERQHPVAREPVSSSRPPHPATMGCSATAPTAAMGPEPVTCTLGTRAPQATVATIRATSSAAAAGTAFRQLAPLVRTTAVYAPMITVTAQGPARILRSSHLGAGS